MRRWALAVLLAAVPHAAFTADMSGTIIGRWTVVDTFCTDCVDHKVERGQTLEFASSSITDPFAGACTSPGYTTFDQTSAAALARTHKFNPAWLAGKPKSAVIVAGYVTCQKLAFIELALLPDDRAIYFYEGGNAFLLEKAR